MANTWNQALTTWGQNQWGEQTQIDVTLTLTGLSATSTVGTVVQLILNIGWGRDTWGFENWGESAITVPVTGISATSTLGTLTTTQLTVASLTGISLAASVWYSSRKIGCFFCSYRNISNCFSRIHYCRNWCASYRTFTNRF